MDGTSNRSVSSVRKKNFFPLYSKICKYEFPKRSLYLYWDNFKQSVGLQGFYQFYYTLAKCLAERAHQCDGRYTSLATLYSSPSFSCVQSRQRDSEMAFHLPKIFSRVAQIIFLRPKKWKTKTSPKNRENALLLIRMSQEKQKTKAKQRNYRLGSLFQRWKVEKQT